MPIRYGIFIPGRVTVVQYSGLVSADELVKIGHDPIVLKQLDDAPAPLVHGISIPCPDLKRVPSLQAIGQKTPLTTHPCFGWAVLIQSTTVHPVTRSVVSIAFQVLRVRYRIVPDLDAAMNFLKYVDTTLPDFPPFESVMWISEYNTSGEPAYWNTTEVGK